MRLRMRHIHGWIGAIRRRPCFIHPPRPTWQTPACMTQTPTSSLPPMRAPVCVSRARRVENSLALWRFPRASVIRTLELAIPPAEAYRWLQMTAGETAALLGGVRGIRSREDGVANRFHLPREGGAIGFVRQKSSPSTGVEGTLYGI